MLHFSEGQNVLILVNLFVIFLFCFQSFSRVQLFCAFNVYQKKHKVHKLDCYIVYNVVHIFLWNVPYIERQILSFVMVQHCVLWNHLRDVLLRMSHIDVFDTCHNAEREQQSYKNCTEIHFLCICVCIVYRIHVQCFCSGKSKNQRKIVFFFFRIYDFE